VPGIDVIISGHTHDKLPQPIQVGKTYIVQTGCYGMALGRMELTFDAAKTLGRVDYRLIALDDAIPGDSAVQKVIDGKIGKIDTLLKPDLSYDKVVAETAFDLTKAPFKETNLGNLISDAYRMTVNKLQPTEPADLAVASSGHIRDEVLRGKTGKIWFADLYRALPLGMGPDNKPGYPLVTYYLKGKEIELWMEMLYLSEKIIGSKSMYFQVSGIQVEYDSSGIVVPLFSVDSVKLTSASGAPEIKDSNTCFKVVSSLAIAKELSRAKEYTFGIWKIDPKLEDCSTKITDLTQRIVDADPAQPGLQELKGWQALTLHVSGFPDADADGIPDIPAAYSTLQNRIVAK
jgi:2',3'-cyclic-nucleotide 2'-phosphodiesterase (5'-nucleotidase family)